MENFCAYKCFGIKPCGKLSFPGYAPILIGFSLLFEGFARHVEAYSHNIFRTRFILFPLYYHKADDSYPSLSLIVVSSTGFKPIQKFILITFTTSLVDFMGNITPELVALLFALSLFIID